MRQLVLTLVLNALASAQLSQGRFGGTYVWLPNEPTTGTVLWQLAKLTSDNPSRVIQTAGGDTAAIGVCVDSCGQSSSAQIMLSGHVKCVFDGGTTAGNFVQISSTLAGRCQDVGSTRPTRGKVVGRVLSTNAIAGTYEIILFGIGTRGSVETPSTSSGQYAKDDGTWGTPSGGGSGSIPSGLITISLSACPTGFTEVSSLAGKMLRGTLVANVDVGGTGGNSTITPSGSVSQPTFTGNAITDVINHTHAVNVTDPGHFHSQAVNSASTGGLSGYTADTSTNTSATSGYNTGSKTTGITAATVNPAGGVSSITPTGTVSQPTFTGNAVDPSPPYTKVIFCSKD